jgi:hypothetical protein
MQGKKFRLEFLMKYDETKAAIQPGTSKKGLPIGNPLLISEIYILLL